MPELDREEAERLTGLSEVEWAHWWRERGWLLGATELLRYSASGYIDGGEWIDEFRSMAFHGTGVTREEWLGILCIVCEVSIDSASVLFTAGDVGFAAFRASPGAEEAVLQARKMFPAVDRCLSNVDEYYSQLDASFKTRDPGDK